MQNRITVTIQGRTYTLVADDNEEYVRRCADYVDKKIAENAGNGLAQVECAALAALNMADELFREKAAGENLRMQIKELMDEAGTLNVQLSQAKREIFKLQQKR